MLMSRTYLDAGWDLVGESAHGTCDRWVMTEGQTPLPVQLDPNFTPHAYQGAGTEADPYRIFDAMIWGPCGNSRRPAMPLLVTSICKTLSGTVP